VCECAQIKNRFNCFSFSLSFNAVFFENYFFSFPVRRHTSEPFYLISLLKRRDVMRVAFPLFLTAIFFVTTDCHFREIDLVDLTKVTIFFFFFFFVNIWYTHMAT
jgi:hypothetical protein